MAQHDLQRVMRGFSLVLQEAVRLKGMEAMTLSKQCRGHVADLTTKLPQALSTIQRAHGLNAAAERTQAERAFEGSRAAATAESQQPLGPVEEHAPAMAAAKLVRPEGVTVSVKEERAADNATQPATVRPAAGKSIDEVIRMSLAQADAPQEQTAAGAGAAASTTTFNPAAAAAATAPSTESKRAEEARAAPVLRPSSPAFTPPTPPASAAAATSSPSVAATIAAPAASSKPMATSTAPPVAATPAPAPRRSREFRERAVPASPLARVVGFGGMAASLVFGAAGNAISKGLFGESPAAGGGAVAGKGAFALTEAQAERLAEGLCRMRGAALKVGQMLSLSDEALLPPQIAKILERVRTQADIMPRKQLEKIMSEELGEDWRQKLGGEGFEDAPIAAASIGQVHRAILPDGRKVAIKVQYPGVAESIDSDLNNLKRLLTVINFLPKGLYMDSVIAVAKEELTAECDYRKEAENQEKFRALVGNDPDFEVPAVVPELSTRRVLVTTWLDGFPIDQVVEQAGNQEQRNKIARKLLKLTIKELFEWRFMQTDPNWGNFFFNPARDVIGLLDFGASRGYGKAFIDDYLQLVWAAANKDRDTIEKLSVKLGFLTGLESKVMVDAHVDSGLVVGEPFTSHAPFDFKASGMTSRVSKYVGVFGEHRLTPPPAEIYSLHRKLAGAFLICIRMGAVMPCRDILEETYSNHKWGPLPGEQEGQASQAGGGAAASASGGAARMQ